MVFIKTAQHETGCQLPADLILKAVTEFEWFSRIQVGLQSFLIQAVQVGVRDGIAHHQLVALLHGIEIENVLHRIYKTGQQCASGS